MSDVDGVVVQVPLGELEMVIECDVEKVMVAELLLVPEVVTDRDVEIVVDKYSLAVFEVAKVCD